MEVTHREMIDIFKGELQQFPELAQKYLANLFFCLLQLRKRSDYMKNAAIIVGTFEREGYFQDAIESMGKSLAHNLYFAMTNFVLRFEILNDEDDLELREFLLSVNKNSVRKKLENVGIVIDEFIPTLLLHYSEKDIWNLLLIRVKFTAIETFAIKDTSHDFLKLMNLIIGDSFESQNVCFYTNSASYFYHDEGRWTKGIIISNQDLGVLILSVIEQE